MCAASWESVSVQADVAVVLALSFIALFARRSAIFSEFSTTVKRSVSTTFAASASTTVTVSKEATFTLRAPPGKTAALWVSTTQLDVFVCKSRTDKVRSNPIDSNCHFSHSVKEDGKRYEMTITDLSK
jgi:hypothetical protein